MTVEPSEILPPVLVLSPGRSGSSLLQQILNRSPQLAIWGEHSGFLHHLAMMSQQVTQDPIFERMHFGVSNDRSHLVRGTEFDPSLSINWSNGFSREDVAQACRHFVLQLFGTGLDLTRVHFGFKEIRYGSDGVFRRFWVEQFPLTRVLVIVRSPATTIPSMVTAWAKDVQPLEESDALLKALRRASRMWAHEVRGLLAWRKAAKDVIGIGYESLIARPKEEIPKIFDALQLPVPPGAFEPLGHFIETPSSEHPLAPRIQECVKRHGLELWDLVKDAYSELAAWIPPYVEGES